MSLDLQNLTPLAKERYLKLDRILKSKGDPVIVAYFPESDLRCGFEGLTKVAKKAGVDFNTLGHGEMVLFTNRKKTAVKLFVAGNVLVYQKAPENMQLVYSAILALPRYFNGKSLDLKAAIHDAVKRDHDQRIWRKTGVPQQKKVA